MTPSRIACDFFPIVVAFAGVIDRTAYLITGSPVQHYEPVMETPTQELLDSQ
jgi:hypothetical protein